MKLMIRQFGIDKELYVCNQCGCIYNIRDALSRKGSSYFCSMECVIKYDKENGNGILQD